MAAEIVRLSLRSRKVHEVKMQRESTTTPGTALKRAIEYVGVSDREIFGPYEEGCVNDGCLCYDVPLQKQIGGTIINVLMRGKSLFSAHYRADDLVSLFGDNAELYIWPDAGDGGYDLGADSTFAWLRHNALNGHAVVDFAGTDVFGMYCAGLTDMTVSRETTIYAVCKASADAWAVPLLLADGASSSPAGLDTSWNPGLSLFGFNGGALSLGYGNFNPQLSQMVYTNKWVFGSRPTDWAVYAFRTGRSADEAAVYVNDAQQVETFGSGLNGFKRLEDIAYEDPSGENGEPRMLELEDGSFAEVPNRRATFQVSLGWCLSGSMSIAEAQIFPTTHDDAAILANVAALKEKYGII